MRRAGRGRPRPGCIHTIRLHRARADLGPREMETKPLGAPSTFVPLTPANRSHLHPHIGGLRASRLPPYSQCPIARDSVRQRRAAREQNEDDQPETPVPLLWTRYPMPSSDKFLSVPASLSRQNARLRRRRALSVLKWNLEPSVVSRSKQLAACARKQCSLYKARAIQGQRSFRSQLRGPWRTSGSNQHHKRWPTNIQGHLSAKAVC